MGIFIAMRETLGSLLLTSQNYIVDPDTTSKTALSDTKTFLKKELNKAYRLVLNSLKNYTTQKVWTTETEDGEQFYRLPPDFNRLQSATLTISDVAYPLQVIDSYNEWNTLNQIDFSGSTTPLFIFIRRDDFGIWPKPSADDNTITLVYNIFVKDMTQDDYITGTVTTVNDDATVTGTDTTFTPAMVGRWFKATDDQEWYRIDSYTGAESIELESVFEGTAVTDSAFIIGESPEIPVQLHELLPYKAVAPYLAGFKRDPVTAQSFLNYFWTGDFNNNSRRLRDAAGGLLGAMKEYSGLGRANSRLVRRRPRIVSPFDERWSSVLE